MSVKLGHFELHDQIGQGGMGTVFRAFDPSLNRNVAIKLLDEELAKDAKFVEEFIREAQNAAAISHPHIVQIYFVGQHEDNYYLVMELLTGRSLSQIVEQDGPLPEALALRIAIEIAEALKAAYTNEMIHGDVKPQNIFVTDGFGSKLLDFGLAKLANVEVTQSDGVWGSAYYVSPERIGQKAEDFRSDIYSLGATIFEALIGRPPFDAPTVEELASKRLSEKPPLLRMINPNITKRTETIINKMLAKSPLLRYLDYDSLIDELRKAEQIALGNASATAPIPVGRTTGRIPVPAKRSQLPAILGIVGAIVVAVAAVVVVMLAKKNPQQTTNNGNTNNPNLLGTPEPSGGAATPLPTPFGTKIWQFKLHDPDAKLVELTGNFDQWTREPMTQEGNGNWTVSKELPRLVALEYQFVVDGKKEPDPQSRSYMPKPDGTLKTVFIIPKEDTPKPTPKPKPSTTPKPTTPKPTPKVSATPFVPVVPTTPTPTSTPTPETVDLVQLAAAPEQWPKVVTLKQAVPFPIVINGAVSGEVQAPAGRQVNLVKVTATELTISWQGSTQVVPPSATDLIERVRAARGH